MVLVNRSTGSFLTCMPKKQNFEVVIVSVNGSTGCSRMGIPELLSRHRVGQQVNRLFSNVYAKMCKLSWCRSTGQQAAFERVCQNKKNLSHHCVRQQVSRLFSNVYAKICKLSWCRSTGQQAAFERVCQNNKK